MKASPAWSRTLGRGGSERPPASGSPVSTAGAETSKAAWVPGTRSSEPTSRAPRLQTPAFWDREAADVCRPGPRLAAHCGGLGKPTRGSARAPSPEPRAPRRRRSHVRAGRWAGTGHCAGARGAPGAAGVSSRGPKAASPPNRAGWEGRRRKEDCVSVTLPWGQAPWGAPPTGSLPTAVSRAG